MVRPERSSYTPVDFITWREADSLVLAPAFQRRGVWSAAARSFLIDTLLLGMPVPPIYLRVRQDRKKNKAVREVIDGQQRVSAVLDYVDGVYALSKSLDSPYAGKKFDRLPVEAQDAIRQFSFSAEVFQGISDKDILEVFARMNTYSVPLNAQELRNGTYFGYFKQSAYGLAHEHIEFWRNYKIFSERSIARMLEVELTSELMIASLAGMQDKKKSIDDFYKKYDEKFEKRRRVEKRFRAVIDVINDSLKESLADSEFSRAPLFYTLFCVIYHRMFSLKGINIASPRTRLTGDEPASLQEAVTFLSEKVEEAREETSAQDRYQSFVNACLRQTDNIRPRQIRFSTLYRRAFD